MFCKVYYRCILKGSLVASLVCVNCIWRYSSGLPDCTASSFLLPLCTKDVYHYGCYLWTQNLDIYLLLLNSSPLHSLFSSPVSSLSPPLCCHTLLTCVCALVPSFSLALDNGSGGCFWYLFFFRSAFVPPLPGNKQKKLLSFFSTRHAIYSVPSTKCGCVCEAVLIFEETETWLDTAIYLIYCVIVWDTL